MRRLQWPGVEIQVLTQITTTASQILGYVLGDVVGRGDWITNYAHTAKTEFVLIVRPVEEAAVYKLLGDTFTLLGRTVEGDQSRGWKATNKAVNVPCAVAVPLRNKKHLELGLVFLAHIPNPLGKVYHILIQVKTVILPLIQGPGEKPLPEIA